MKKLLLIVSDGIVKNFISPSLYETTSVFVMPKSKANFTILTPKCYRPEIDSGQIIGICCWGLKTIGPWRG